MIAPRDDAAAAARTLATLDGAEFAVQGRRLLGPVTLALRAGERLVLMGPNGAGKSSALRLLHGLSTPSAGAVHWAAGATPADQAMVFQRPVLLRRSAAANIDYALAARGLRGAEKRRRRADALARAGLSDRADAPARALSGGEQQRLAVARALAVRPKLLLLDEPTASLDPPATAAVERLIGLAVADGATVLLVTHDAGQARRCADRVVFMTSGRIVEDARAADFFAQPRSVDARNYLAGRLVVDDGTATAR